MGTTGRTTVFIVDDHELVRAALRESLRRAPDLFVVGEAGSAQEALRRIPLIAPDVALLDVRLPDGNGLEICRQIRSSSGSVRCLFLSHDPSENTLTEAVLAGAAGFLMKDVSIEALIDSIRRVAAGESLLSFETLQSTLQLLKQAEGAGDDRLARLTETERRILDLIGEGLSNREIADRLVLAEQTVKNYVSRVLTKLGMKSRTEAALLSVQIANKRPPGGQP